MARKDSDDDKMNDQPDDNSADNFGLPDIEFKPLDETAGSKPDAETDSDLSAQTSAMEERPSESTSADSYAVDESKSKAPIILGVVIVLVVIIAGYLIYDFVYKPKAAEAARKEQLAKLEAQQKREEAAIAAKKLEEETRRRQAEELANAKPATGTIEMLSGRTKRYYAVVSSDVDDDLLMDYAKKLSDKGVSTKIIPPFGGKKFYRLAIGDDETFALAQIKADAAKAEYGPTVWVLKY